MKIKIIGAFQQIRVELPENKAEPKFLLEIRDNKNLNRSFQIELKEAQNLINLLALGDSVQIVFDNHNKILEIEVKEKNNKSKFLEPVHDTLTSLKPGSLMGRLGKLNEKLFLAHLTKVSAEAACEDLEEGVYASCYVVPTKEIDSKTEVKNFYLEKVIFKNLSLSILLKLVNIQENITLNFPYVFSGKTENGIGYSIFFVVDNVSQQPKGK